MSSTTMSSSSSTVYTIYDCVEGEFLVSFEADELPFGRWSADDIVNADTPITADIAPSAQFETLAEAKDIVAALEHNCQIHEPGEDFAFEIIELKRVVTSASFPMVATQ